MHAFVTFIKVVGNESYITADKEAITNFKTFVQQVVRVACSNPKFKPLLRIVFSDVVNSYRAKLKDLTKRPVHI